MSAVVISKRRPWSRLILLGALAGGVAGCSGDTSRFNNPNSNPFSSGPAASNTSYESTGSVQAAPTSRIASQSLPPPNNMGRPSTVASAGISGGGQGMGSYTPPATSTVTAATTTYAPPARQLPPPTNHEVTGSIQRPTQQSTQGWSSDGGTVVQVGPGESAESLARKYGVPAHAILQANNLHSAAEVRPGQRIVIPHYQASAAAGETAHALPIAAHTAATTTTATPAAAAGGNVHVVAAGETLMSISRRYHKPVAQIAAANKIAPQAHLRIGARLVIPGKVTAAQATTTTQTAPPVTTAPKVQTAPVQTATPKVVASAEQQPVVRVAAAGAAATAAATTTTASTGPTFRWPLRGRVVGSFGQKANGQHSDGIDLAVPEGTAVHASEDGVVAYAGNELKGYGNLILIRHADGYVTAYAHASELLVKRNDQVRRGQVIAKSGQTGAVTAPQLHFEIRKGSSPIDPMQFLGAAGNT